MVADAQHRKPRIQAFADQIARVFVPAVMVLASLTWATWAVVAVVFYWAANPDWWSLAPFYRGRLRTAYALRRTAPKPDGTLTAVVQTKECTTAAAAA